MSANATRRMTGGQALAEMLKLHEAGPMFGMGGFQLLPFYEACRALGVRTCSSTTSAAAPSRPTPMPA
jgi:acetolactate synthase-1/2/3 large subunit